MKRDVIIVAVLWGVLTAVGEIIVLNSNLFPMVAAEEAAMIDSAFRTLMILGTPVATLVLAWLGYNLVKFRAGGDVNQDGIPLRGNRRLAWGWFLVSTGLAILVVFNPGLKGINELNANPNAELVIQVEAEQWHWNVTYPDYGLSYQRALQIAVPVGTRVRFELTSKDVIHSFWIPAFRLKMDAVPGRTTNLYVTPSEIGSFENEPSLRVQCAELCGTGHARMQMAVHVMEEAEFSHWLEQARQMTMGAEMEMDMPGMDTGSESMDMDSDSGMDMESDSGMDMDSDSEMDMDAGSEMDTDSDSEMGTDSDSGMDMESNSNMDMDSGSEMETGSDAEMDMDSDSSMDMDSEGTDMDSDSGMDMNENMDMDSDNSNSSQ